MSGLSASSDGAPPSKLLSEVLTGLPAADLARLLADWTLWARDDEQREEILAGLRGNAKPEITRLKGLGEMPPAELKATTLDPRSRTLLKVDIDSNLEADSTFVELLGKDPSSRYKFIMQHAAQAVAEDLDV